MKKFTILSLFILLASALGAQLTSNLVIFNENNQPFTVLLNGQRVNDRTAKNLKITGLRGGSYTVKVIFSNPQWGNFNSVLYIEPGHEATYAARRENTGAHYFQFVSEFDLNYAPVMPEPQTEIAFNDPEPAPVVTQPVVTPVVQPAETTSVVVTTTTTTTPAPVEVVTPPNPLPGYTGPVGCAWPMSQTDFEGIKASVKSKTFESTKLTLAKQALGNQCILTSQIVEIMGLFTSESSKLDIAKWAWDYTYDRGNYYKINDAFTFSSSIDELDEFLKGK